MPPLTREQLSVRRSGRRRDERIRHRRVVATIILPLTVAVLLAVVIGLFVVRSGSGSGSGAGQAAGSVAPPVAAAAPPAAGAGDVVVARAAGADLHLPIARSQVTAIVFRAVDDPAAIALAPNSGGISYDVASSDGTPGPDTGSLDVGAAAGTPVYSPVDGTVTMVAPYVVAGRQEGYELSIAPTEAADVVVQLTHLETPAGGSAPTVGSPVRAGLAPPVGQVSDFSRVADQELAQYTSDSGNHVHIEVVRLGGDLVP
jgi:hypothetical protein